MAVWEAGTGAVVSFTTADVAPAGTVTPAGAATAASLSLASVTTAPSAGAGPLKITVAVTSPPPMTSAGLTAIAAIVPGCPAGDMTSSRVVATPAGEAAVRKTGVGVETGAVVTGKA